MSGKKKFSNLTSISIVASITALILGTAAAVAISGSPQDMSPTSQTNTTSKPSSAIPSAQASSTNSSSGPTPSSSAKPKTTTSSSPSTASVACPTGKILYGLEGTVKGTVGQNQLLGPVTYNGPKFSLPVMIYNQTGANIRLYSASMTALSSTYLGMNLEATMNISPSGSVVLNGTAYYSSLTYRQLLIEIPSASSAQVLAGPTTWTLRTPASISALWDDYRFVDCKINIEPVNTFARGSQITIVTEQDWWNNR